MKPENAIPGRPDHSVCRANFSGNYNFVRMRRALRAEIFSELECLYTYGESIGKNKIMYAAQYV